VISIKCMSQAKRIRQSNRANKSTDINYDMTFNYGWYLRIIPTMAQTAQLTMTRIVIGKMTNAGTRFKYGVRRWSRIKGAHAAETWDAHFPRIGAGCSNVSVTSSSPSSLIPAISGPWRGAWSILSGHSIFADMLTAPRDLTTRNEWHSYEQRFLGISVWSSLLWSERWWPPTFIMRRSLSVPPIISLSGQGILWSEVLFACKKKVGHESIGCMCGALRPCIRLVYRAAI